MNDFRHGEINNSRGVGFRYVTAIGPIDFWEFTLSREQIINNIANSSYESMDEIRKLIDIENRIVAYVEYIEEEPHTIRYISTPYGNEMSLIAIAKISNNGTCFVFSDDYEYLKYLRESSY